MAYSTPIPSAQLVTCTTSTYKQRVVFLLLPEVHLLDFAGPVQVFHMANQLGARYQLIFSATQPEVCSEQGIVLAQLSPLTSVSSGDLVLVPGISLENRTLEDVLLETETRQWLSSAHAAGAHVASVCTGAFLLGEAGLLNSRRCTTHWALVQDLQVRHPKAKVLDNVLFVQDQGLTTSAGVTSGIDMALSFLEQAHGPLFTAQVARYLVIYLRRNGTQPQCSVYLQYRTHLHPGIHRVQDYLIHNPTVHVSLEQLSAIANLSTRSLTRAFKQATGVTPIQYQQRLKLELATTLLQNPELSIEEIANRCGFDDARHFRRLWRSQFGSPPSSQRSQQATSYTYL